MSIYTPPGKIRNTLKILQIPLIGVLGIILFTAACNTNPAKTASAADSAAAKTPGDEVASNEEKLVCHYVTGTGTNLARKVCASQAAWDRYNEKTRENAEEYTRRAREKGAVTAPLSPTEQAIGRGTVTGPMGQ